LRDEECDNGREGSLGTDLREGDNEGGSTISSGSSKQIFSDSVSASSSSSLKLMKFCFVDNMDGDGRLEGFERPSRRAKASERLALRVRVDTEEVVTMESRFGSWCKVSGAEVREMVREGAE
jgi:hypothetical protein